MKRRELVAVAKATFSELGRDDVSLLAAGLTYYAFFGLFPLILLSITLAGLLVKPEDATNFIFTRVAEIAPGFTRYLSDAADKAFSDRSNAGLLALIGVLALAFSASNAFGTLYKAVNRAWNTEHRPSFLMDKVISFLMMLVLAALFITSVIVSAVLTSIRAFTQFRIGKVPGEQIIFQVTSIGLSMALTFVVLLLMYWFVPRTKVQFHDVWFAALVASVVWTLFKELFALYLGSSFATYDAVYGTAGTVIALLTWIYVSSLIILTGAEFASETHRFRRLHWGVEEDARNFERRSPGSNEESPWFGKG